MGNCLVTKLKAAVNNPDLPIIETMQQFTLDAITASENVSMTDAQKLALNHFFYKIGAIDNNGIFAKLEILLLSFMCGTKEGALVDFAKDHIVAGTSSSVTFSDGGFTGDVNNRTVGKYSISEIDDNYFVFIASPVSAAKVSLVGTRNDNDCTMSATFNSDRIALATSPYSQYSSYVATGSLSFTSKRAMSVNVRNHGARIVTIDGATISEVSSVTYRQVEEGIAVEEVRLITNTNNNGPYALAFGSGLSDAEQTLFMTEIKTLMDAFAAS